MKRTIAFHKENGGSSSARNLGISKASGDYLGFVDSDDYIEADMSKFLASIIDFLNHDVSMGAVMTPTDRINRFLEKYNAREDMISDEE